MHRLMPVGRSRPRRRFREETPETGWAPARSLDSRCQALVIRGKVGAPGGPRGGNGGWGGAWWGLDGPLGGGGWGGWGGWGSGMGPGSGGLGIDTDTTERGHIWPEETDSPFSTCFVSTPQGGYSQCACWVRNSAQRFPDGRRYGACGSYSKAYDLAKCDYVGQQCYSYQ